MLSPTEMMLMVGQAAMVIDSLEQQEAEMKYFRYGMAKRIKCPYCEHKGQSVLEESTPVHAWLLCFAVYILMGIYSFVVMPCILGLLRDQRHRCPKCRNEIKEDSVFSCLDDNLMAFNIGSFGVLITRRILLKLFVAIICAGLAYESYDFVIEGPSWYLDGREADATLTWEHFVRDCGL